MKTHTLRLAKQLFAGLFSIILLAGSTSSYGQVLLAGTEFNPLPGKESKPYLSIEDVEWYGMLKPKVLMGPNLIPNLNAGVFHSSSHYAITNNPFKLDNLRYSDLSSSPDYQITYSRSDTAVILIDLKLLGDSVFADFEVHISYCNPVNALDTSCKNRGARMDYKFYAQEYSNGLAPVQMGQCRTIILNRKELGRPIPSAYPESFLTLRNDPFFGLCSAISITKIEVYGIPKPIVDLSGGTTLCAGDYAKVSVSNYSNFSYQWQAYQEQGWTDIPNENQRSLFYKTAEEKMYQFRVKLTPETGMPSYSDSISFDAIQCCTSDGKKSSLQTVFKEDFGRIDLMDKTGMSYYHWDYSNPFQPVEVRKNTTTPFRWKEDNVASSFLFAPMRSITDGYYTTAAYLTGYTAYRGYNGAMLEWANSISGVRKFDGTIPTDHSGKVDGAALFLNCPFNSQGTVLYKRGASILCPGTTVFFEAWITIFTLSSNGVDVTLKVTDAYDAARSTQVKATAFRTGDFNDGKPRYWVKIRGKLDLSTSSDSIIMEIINNAPNSWNIDGNDLLLDDIAVHICSTPQPESFFNATALSKTDTLCDEPFQLELLENENLNNYYNNQPYFLHQYSKTPADLASWKNLGTPSSQSKAEIVGSTLVGVSNGDKVYFRTVVATDATFATKNNFQGAGNYANGNDACKNYSVSAPISALWTNSVKCSFSTDLYSAEETETFHVYPNPTKEVLMVGEQAASTHLYNTMGQLVLQATTSVVQVGHLQAGLYQVTVHLKNGKTVTQKVVKE